MGDELDMSPESTDPLAAVEEESKAESLQS